MKYTLNTYSTNNDHDHTTSHTFMESTEILHFTLMFILISNKHKRLETSRKIVRIVFTKAISLSLTITSEPDIVHKKTLLNTSKD